MQIFDHIDPSNLERREWHLWTLAITLIVILSAGLALLMYPTVFGTQVVISGRDFRGAFFGFCALSTLLAGYLVDRQIVISHLRKGLLHDRTLITKIRLEASADMLDSLPGIDHFRDRLAMEHRRASGTHQPLSVLVAELTPGRDVHDEVEIQTAFGDAAKALTRKLRGEDSIYRFAPGVFGIVLPEVDAASASRVAGRLSERLRDAAGASGRFESRVRVFNYPEHAATARELDQAVRGCFPHSHQYHVREGSEIPSAVAR